MDRIEIIAIDKKTNEKIVITDLYWFEENGIHWFDDKTSWSGEWDFQINIVLNNLEDK